MAEKRKLEDAEQPNEKYLKAAHPIKILVCGDVKGEFSRLFNKVNDLNAGPSGPFDILFCVGQFFSEEDEYKGASNEDSLAFIAGEKPINVPTYFIEGGHGSEFIDKNPDGCRLCQNLTFLGRSGVKYISGLNIMYLSGVYDSYSFKSSISTLQNYSEIDIRKLEQQVKDHSLTGKIDILLTSEWPQDITKQLPQDQVDNIPQLKNIGAIPTARLNKCSKPRYHFSALSGFFYERLPYVSKLDDNNTTITRFISLAPVSDSKDKIAKYLYAAKLTPVSGMDVEQIQKEPPNTTASPYDVDANRLVREKQLQKSTRGQHNHNKHNNHSHGVRRPMTGDTSQCWFCLSNPQVEKHLISSIGDETYLAIPKGSLVPHHCLIIPLAHTNDLASVNQQALSEINQYITCLRQLHQEQKVIIFERNLWLSKVSTHMHLQVVPLGDSVTNEQCYEVLEKDAKHFLGDDIQIHVFDKSVGLKEAIDLAGLQDSQYFLAELPDGRKFIHEITDNRIRGVMNLGRRPCAELLGMLEREDWRECTMPIEEEKKATAEFKKNFKAFDFTN
ncbi:hypothetical protein AKO1_013055 [Acrasis kona]|uniref:CWF19-like protein 1 n=1 Tax=Acrasis kona TaxID=1008807 RepID=A0AAW2YZU9_9EUKA